MGIKDYSATPASNTAINGINIAENCNASGINDAIRQLMADIAAITVEATIASASTTDLSTTDLRALITGSVAITSFGSKVSARREIRFSGAPLITYNATSLITPTAANIQAAPGDTAVVESDSSGNWTVVSYTPAGGVLLSSFTAADLAASYAQVAAVTLSPGKWRLSASVFINAAVSATYMNLAISTTTASTAGTTVGKTLISTPISAVPAGLGVFPGVDVTVTTNTPYYFNVVGNGTGAAALAGFLRAERIY
jgi:hypothetical protein